MKYRIKELRKQQHISQETLMELSGVSRATLSKLEARPTSAVTVETLEKLASALKVDITELFLTD